MNEWRIAAMKADLHLLHSPLGQPGSGRVRYGAAMALAKAGHLSEAQLDVYRDAAAFDGRDPAPMLAERGLPAVPFLLEGAVDQIAALVDAACDYLNALVHPGAAEVRIGLAAARGVAALPVAQASAVVTEWMPRALENLRKTHGPLAKLIAGAAPHLHWITYDAYPPDQIGPIFGKSHAYASLIGDAAPFFAPDFDLGLFLIAPGTLYRDHHHAAPELYVPLTGPHGWRFGPTTPLIVKPAHLPIWNPPFRPHLTKVGSVPFLAFFVWTRDVKVPASLLPADDWPALETLDL